jgi:hypothetical protein
LNLVDKNITHLSYVPPLTRPHLRIGSACFRFVGIDFRWRIYKVLGQCRILPKAFDSFYRVPMTDGEFCVGIVVKIEMRCLPFSCAIRERINFLVQGTSIVIGKVQLINNLAL